MPSCFYYRLLDCFMVIEVALYRSSHGFEDFIERIQGGFIKMNEGNSGRAALGNVNGIKVVVLGRFVVLSILVSDYGIICSI